MKHIRGVLLGSLWLCIGAAALSIVGCEGPRGEAGWNGVFKADVAGGAKTCVAPAASPPDGEAVVAQVQVANDGGWCGITATRGGAPYDSYLLVTHPSHGKVFAHRVGGNTRIDYTPDPAFAGTDKFSVRMIPGNAVIEGAVTVTR